jgi:hypothetical protein
MKKLKYKHLFEIMEYNIPIKVKNKITFINTIIKSNKTGFKYSTFDNPVLSENLNDCYPILRPMTDLIKQLPNGKIPIIECFCLAIDRVSDSFIEPKLYIENETAIVEFNNENDLVHGFEIDFESDNFGFDCFQVLNKTLDIFEIKDITHFKPVNNTLKIMEYLKENWFDIHGLIDNKLAININNYGNYFKFETN